MKEIQNIVMWNPEQFAKLVGPASTA